MEEIDLTNIVFRRTRGKKIDYRKEAEAAGNDLEDDDEDDEEYVPSLFFIDGLILFLGCAEGGKVNLLSLTVRFH
jgi:Histone chaperone domain CHZ